jgi:ABC-2 type transport system permease protein
VVFQVARLGDPDWGAILGGYLASALVAAAFLAVGMLFSSLSRNQVVAFILGVAASALFLLLGLPQALEVIGNLLGGYVEQVFAGLSLVDHFETLSRGLLEIRSLLFFVLFTLGWLVCGMLVLDRTRAA